jgi:hypothetical protein
LYYIVRFEKGKRNRRKRDESFYSSHDWQIAVALRDNFNYLFYYNLYSLVAVDVLADAAAVDYEFLD